MAYLSPKVTVCNIKLINICNLKFTLSCFQETRTAVDIALMLMRPLRLPIICSCRLVSTNDIRRE